MARRKTSGCFALLLFILVGGVFCGIGYFVMLRPEMEVSSRFVEGTCTLLGKEIISEKSSSRNSRKRVGSSGKLVHRPEFHIRHEVAGQSYESRTYRMVDSANSSKSSSEKVLARYEVGKSYPCYYDPSDPSRVVLEKGVSFGSIAFTGIGGLFVLIGLGGIAAWILRKMMGRR